MYKSVSTIKHKNSQPLISLEMQILKDGLNSEPTSANVVAKRLHMKESHKNLELLRHILEKMVREQKAYKCGSRYAIDYRGGINLMQSFCFKISDEGYKINNFVFDKIYEKA